MTAESNLRTLLGGELAARRWRLAAVLGLSLAASALALLPPWLAKLLVDDGLGGRRMDLVALYCALMIAAALAGMAVGAGNRWHYLTLSGEMLFGLRQRVLAHLRRLPPDFVARRGVGEVLSRLDGDVAEVQRFAVDSLLAAVNAVLVLAGMVAMMAVIAPVLMLPALVLLPLQVVLARRLRPRVEAMTRAVRQRNGDLSGYLVEALRTVKLTAAMGAEAREGERFAALNRRYLGELRRAEMLGMAAAGLPALCNGLAAAGVFLLGGGMVMDGALSLGSLLAFSLYLGRAGGPVNTLTGLILAQRRARVSLERIGEILDRPPAVEAPAHPRRLPADARGAIELCAVAFAHPGGGAVLGGASARFPAGGKTGVVGASGAGKSTLIDLLHRHYDPDAGVILLDGVDLCHLDPAELRRRVAVVDQEPALVAGTIADNIRLADPDASDRAVAEAARRAELGDLPLHRPVGEDGMILSGGERQRVAIARALLRDPLVLILDEAASAVDLGTCRRIARTIDTLFAGRTRIVISHHPEMLERADAILELRDGRLAARRAEPAA